MFCYMCGEKVPDGAKFCPACGAKLALSVESQETGEVETKDMARSMPVNNKKIYTEDIDHIEVNEDHCVYFKIFGREYCYHISIMNYTAISLKLEDFAKEARNQIKECYESCQSIDSVIEELPAQYDGIIGEAVELLHEEMQEKFSLSEGEIIRGVKEFLGEWENVFDALNSTCFGIAEVSQSKNESKIEGLGTSIKIASKKSQIYHNANTLEKLLQAVYDDIMNLRFYYFKMSAIEFEDVREYTREDKQKAEELYSNIVSGQLEKGRMDAILALFDIFPFEEKYGELLWSEISWDELLIPSVVAWLDFLGFFIDVIKNKWIWKVFVSLINLEEAVQILPAITVNLSELPLNILESSQYIKRIFIARCEGEEVFRQIKFFPTDENYLAKLKEKLDWGFEKIVVAYEYYEKDCFIITNRNIYINSGNQTRSYSIGNFDILKGPVKLGVPYILFRGLYNDNGIEVPVSVKDRGGKRNFEIFLTTLLYITSVIGLEDTLKERGNYKEAFNYLINQTPYFKSQNSDYSEEMIGKIDDQKIFLKNILLKQTIPGGTEVLNGETDDGDKLAAINNKEYNSQKGKTEISYREGRDTNDCVYAYEMIKKYHLESVFFSTGESIVSNSPGVMTWRANMCAETYRSLLDTNEVPLFYYDDTLGKTGKDGFVLTSFRLIYKSFSTVSSIRISDIKTIRAIDKYFTPGILINETEKISLSIAGKNMVLPATDFLKEIVEYLKGDLKDEEGQETIIESEAKRDIDPLIQELKRMTLQYKQLQSVLIFGDEVRNGMSKAAVRCINARRSYAPYSDSDRLIMQYDDTISGNGKEGFVITEQKIYYKTTAGRGDLQLKEISSVISDCGLISGNLILNLRVKISLACATKAMVPILENAVKMAVENLQK